MNTQLTTGDFRLSLADHVLAKAADARAKYGPGFGWDELQRLLLDRAFVRYPCEIVFDVTPLHDGEFAHPVPCGDKPEDGFRVCVHPYFASRPDAVVALVLYQLVLVNYGDFASPAEAEAFGAGILGLSTDDYYALICDLADEIAAPEGF